MGYVRRVHHAFGMNPQKAFETKPSSSFLVAAYAQILSDANLEDNQKVFY